MERMDTDVIIVGPGIFGLSCARHLMKANIKFILLEATESVGAGSNHTI